MSELVHAVTLHTGSALHAHTWEPASAASEVVLCLHGVESHSGWFCDVAAALVAQGLAVHAFDRPGWGESAGPRGHLASYRYAVAQVADVATQLRARFERVHLAGLSWGGLLALYVALRRGVLFDSLTLIAPGICSRTDIPWWQKLRVAGGVLSQVEAVAVPLAIRVEQFTKRADQQAFIRDDPHRVKHVSASFCVETLKMRRFVHTMLGRRLLPPAQVLLASDDTIVDNDRTQALLGPHDVATKRYEACAHSLVFEAPERVVRDIADLAASHRSVQARRVAIMGAGAVGSAVGGLLALGGHEVTLVARPAHADAVNTRGLTLRVGCGERCIRENLRAVTAAAQSQAADLVILAVKSFDTKDALQAMGPLVQNQTVILSLQNGLTNEKAIADAFPRNTILAGAICAYLEFVAPGVIAWADDRGGLAGALFQGDEHRAVELWRDTLPRTGMESPYVGPNAARCGRPCERVKWSKLMLNVAFNALNAVTDLPTAGILAHPEYGALAVRALQEGFQVMRTQSVDPLNLPGYPVRQLAALARLPANWVRRVLAWKTSREPSGASSMRQDRVRGRDVTEIDAINGAVVETGEACGVAAPANARLCAMMREALHSTET